MRTDRKINREQNHQAALDAARVCLDADGSVALEEGIAPEVVSELSRRGHRVVVVRGHARAQFGRGQVILVRHESPVGTGGDADYDDDTDTMTTGGAAERGVAVPKTMRVLIGGSDGRADGCAMASSS
jgi:gamma-glutamyltranspeptidase